MASLRILSTFCIRASCQPLAKILLNSRTRTSMSFAYVLTSAPDPPFLRLISFALWYGNCIC